MGSMDFNVLDYGATGNGKTLETAAIQAAIDACTEAGGRVLIPEGEYLSGTIRLKSNVELHLCHGARLVASTDLADYNPLDEYVQNQGVSAEGWAGHHLIICVEQENVAISGAGTIDGSSAAFFGESVINPTYYPWRRGCRKLTHKIRPGQLICFVESKNVTVRDVTLQNAPCWTCFLHGCEYVTVTGIKIFNPHDHLNTDGIDVDSCRHVTISDCTVRVGDDAIAIRGSARRLKNKDRVCEHVTVKRCVLSSNSSAVRVGVGTNAIRHIQVSDITVEAAGIGINFFPEWADTSHTPIYDVSFRGITATNVGRMIELNVNHGTPVERVQISDMRAEAMSALRLHCSSPDAARSIRLQNVEISAIQDVCTDISDLPEHRCAYFVRCSGIEDLSFENCRFRVATDLLPQWRDTVSITNCTTERTDYTVVPESPI